MNEKIFLGVPTRDGRIDKGQVNCLISAFQSSLIDKVQIEHGSWITRNFNACFANALNARPKATHFCLLHDDVVPQQADWLQKLLDVSMKVNADVLSVVVPLKTQLGITSTALDQQVKDYDQRYRVRRLTMTEIFERTPTFTDPQLLLNTGLMLIDIRKPWVENIWFEFVDRIEKFGDKFVGVGMSEDWNFSRQARKLGASLWATREISVRHMGGGEFPNDQPWGLVKTDE
jgi:hypothetical protein